MENNVSAVNSAVATTIISSEALLKHWQGHRDLTRRMIEAFPEDKLFSFSIGGMRPFAELAQEMLRIDGPGIYGLLNDNWHDPEAPAQHSDYKALKTKEEILRDWDRVTALISSIWPQIPLERFSETVKAFGQWDGTATSILFYFIDNEIHHRGQGYVYLRALGIEPPPFWDRP